MWYGCAAQYVGLGVLSRIVLLPGLCALDLCWPSQGLCAFDVNRTEMRSRYILSLWYGCAAECVGLGVLSRVVLLPGLCAFEVCWPSLGLCAFDVNRTRYAALYVGLYVQSRVVLLPGL